MSKGSSACGTWICMVVTSARAEVKHGVRNRFKMGIKKNCYSHYLDFALIPRLHVKNGVLGDGRWTYILSHEID